MVAVVVHRTVPDIVLVHHADDLHDGLLVVGRVAVDLDIEDVAASGQRMIGRLDLGLMARRTVIVDRHMVGVGVVILVGHARNHAERLAVFLGEFARETLGRSGEDGIVVLVFLAELVDAAAHVAHDLQTERLRLLALAMVLARQGD